MQNLSNYDKKRISNIVWTITGKYGYEIDFSLLEEDYFNYDIIYNAVVLGSLYNILDYSMIFKFIDNVRKNINKHKEILTIFFICIEETCINKNIEFIQNIDNIRFKNYKKSINKLDFLREKDRFDNALRLSYWHKNTDKIMKFPKNINSIIYSIEDFRKIDNTIDFIEKFKEIINIYFRFEDGENDESVDTITDNENKLSHSKIKDINKKNKETIYQFFDNYTSSEFNPNESVIEKNLSADSSTMDDKEDLSKEEENLLKMEKYYGKSIYDLKSLHFFEKKHCTGIHQSYKLFFTKGDLSSIKDDYRKSQINEEQKKNKYEYAKNEDFYKQSIEKLKSIIRQSLQQDEKIRIKSYNGNIDAKLIYKAEKINDYKIFKKEKRREDIKFLVDIVIDSSASLLEKQEKLSTQAYIISKSLQDLKIENSVKTFNSFMDYTIIKTLKEYNDYDSEKCFDYFCSGGNRDGLAIDVIGSMSDIKSDYKRLMIIFTDAKPFDVQVMHAIGTKAKKPYQGDMAIDDSANAIRKLMQKNIKLCGIFSGNEKDIGILRYIYGSNFIYIDNLEQFSVKVGKFISSYISGFYEV